MTKRAFFILGPESSGTKFLTSLFKKVGCEGNSWHRQKLEHNLPTEDLVVFRRSYPHNGVWPSIEAEIQRFKEYKIFIIIIVRSETFVVHSRKKYVGGDIKNRAKIAMQTIFSQWKESNLPGTWITYEALVTHPDFVIENLFKRCDLKSPTDYSISDGNKKYV